MQLLVEKSNKSKGKEIYKGFNDIPFMCMNGVQTIKEVCKVRQTYLAEFFECDFCTKKIGRKRNIKRTKDAYSA